MAIDPSKPHVGRIYDYVLGGHHNYEADRQAAAAILKVFPTYPQWAKLNRWFLQYVANQWQEQGYKQVLDLATGLPTEGHFNEILPDARILFTDNDPVSVAYGNEALKDNPNMKYGLADVGKPETIIEQATAFFGSDRKVAIGFIGIAYIVPDQVIVPLLRSLHSWCGPGSVLAISYATRIEGEAGQSADNIGATYKRLANIETHLRTLEQLATLAAPWRVRLSQPLQNWLGVPDFLSQEEIQAGGFTMSGALLEV